MPVIVATVIGLVIWIVLYAFDVKGFDGAMLAAAIILGGTLTWMIGPYLRNLIRP